MNAIGKARGDNARGISKRKIDIRGMELRLLKRYESVGMLFAISSKTLSSTGVVAVGCHRCPQTL